MPAYTAAHGLALALAFPHRVALSPPHNPQKLQRPSHYRQGADKGVQIERAARQPKHSKTRREVSFRRVGVAQQSDGAKDGGAKGIRTPDLLIANETRYQLRHSPKVYSHFSTANSPALHTPHQEASNTEFPAENPPPHSARRDSKIASRSKETG